MTPEQAQHLLKILRYYVRESTNVLSDPRDFDPATVKFAKDAIKGAKK
jgi:hypothetical protein